MRLSICVVAAVAAMTASLAGGTAQAFGLPGTPSGSSAQVEQVRIVCSRSWNGYRWVQICRDVYVRPRYIRPRYAYPPIYAPAPRYYGY